MKILSAFFARICSNQALNVSVGIRQMLIYSSIAIKFALIGENSRAGSPTRDPGQRNRISDLGLQILDFRNSEADFSPFSHSAFSLFPFSPFLTEIGGVERRKGWLSFLIGQQYLDPPFGLVEPCAAFA